MEEKKTRHGIFGPILLIVLGILLFLNAMKVFPGSFWDFLFRMWPLLFIAGGLDSLYKREGYTGALVGIGIGTVFLLANLGFLSVGAFQLLFRLWPVLLIGWGFDLLLRPRNTTTTVIGLLIGLLLISGIVWLSLSSPFGVQKFTSVPINQELGNAKEGDITIVSPVGALNIHDGATDQNIVEGNIAVSSLEKTSTDYSIQDGVGYFKIDSEGVSIPIPFMGGNKTALWDLSLTSDVPVALSSQMITGDQVVDLSGLDIKGYAGETIVGSLDLTLPEDSVVTGSARVVIGELVLHVPQDEPVIIALDTGLTSVLPANGYVREGDILYSPGAKTAKNPTNIRLEVPIGTITIEYIH
ncbi:MAG: DUF5668 domain-containing protein [Anaerolineaceae bacterium]